MHAKITRLHERAVRVATVHKKSEAELISILQEIEVAKAYLHFEARSLYDYCERILGLSESTSYNLITVARRSREVPALKKAVELGAITVSKARRIAPVLTRENQDAWLELAATKSSREIEHAVATANPQAAAAERVQYIAEDLLRARLDIPESLMKKLRRIQDLESQRTATAVSLVEALEAMADSYIERHDPIEKAKRAQARSDAKRASAVAAESRAAVVSVPAVDTVDREQAPGDEGRNGIPKEKRDRCSLGTGRATRRAAIPAAVRHAVRLRDGGQCTYTDSYGRCRSTRWTEQHHIVPISEGGPDTMENITTLCTTHHRHVHGHSRICEPTTLYVA